MSLIGDKYHLLDWPLGAEWIDKLLGRIVQDKEHPLVGQAPPADQPAEGPEGSWIPQKIVPNLADAPVPYTTLHYLLKDLKASGQKAELTRFFHERATRKTGTETEIVAIEVERIDISNTQYKLDQLMQNVDYARWAKAILLPESEGMRTLGLVTGILVSKSITVVESDAKATSIEAGAQIPTGELAGIPTNSLDVGLAANRDHMKEKKTESTIEARGVFAVAYTDVHLQPIALPSQKAKGMKKLRIGPFKHKDNPNLDYKVKIDDRIGAKNFHGSDSGSESSRDDATVNGSVTDPSKPVEEREEEDQVVIKFTTPDSVF